MKYIIKFFAGLCFVLLFVPALIVMALFYIFKYLNDVCNNEINYLMSVIVD